MGKDTWLPTLCLLAIKRSFYISNVRKFFSPPGWSSLPQNSLLRWKMIIVPIPTTSLIHSCLRECTFWTWEGKASEHQLQVEGNTSVNLLGCLTRAGSALNFTYICNLLEGPVGSPRSHGNCTGRISSHTRLLQGLHWHWPHCLLVAHSILKALAIVGESSGEASTIWRYKEGPESRIYCMTNSSAGTTINTNYLDLLIISIPWIFRAATKVLSDSLGLMYFLTLQNVHQGASMGVRICKLIMIALIFISCYIKGTVCRWEPSTASLAHHCTCYIYSTLSVVEVSKNIFLYNYSFLSAYVFHLTWKPCNSIL